MRKWLLVLCLLSLIHPAFIDASTDLDRHASIEVTQPPSQPSPTVQGPSPKASTKPSPNLASTKRAPRYLAATGREKPREVVIQDEEEILSFKTKGAPPLVVQAVALTIMALLPFMLMLLTPFAKFVMVFGLLRNALGVQQTPPNQVINGIALILSLFVMFPVGLAMYESAAVVIDQKMPKSLLSDETPRFMIEVAYAAKEPLRAFLVSNAQPSHQKNFYRIAYRMVPEQFRSALTLDHFVVLAPAYITTQVKNGFEIGALIYLPFFVVDLVVSNILLAMGMMMLSPITISMPLKIFLLVMLDGWTLLTEGLILTYR